MKLMRVCRAFVCGSNLINQGAMTLRRRLATAITLAAKCVILLLALWSQASASISHTKIFVQQGGNSSSLTFTFTGSANAANEAVVVGVDCVSNTAATAVSLTGSGWTFTQLGGIGFSGSSSAAVFGAISPNTTSATFTVTWTGAGSCTFHREMGDEFGGVNTTGGTTTFDCGTTCSGGSNNAHSTNGSCSVNVTTGSANEAVWGVCWPSSSVTALGTGYSAGANDAQGDRAEYKLTTDAAGTLETVNFTSTTTYNAVAVTIKPADAGGTSPSITSLSPVAGPVGTPVTISGSSFGSTQGTSTVSFGGVNVTPTSWTSTAIGVTVPAGLSLGSASVSVTVPGSGTSNSATFTVVAPLAVAASAAPTANAAGWNNSNVTVSYQCTGGVAPVQCPSSQTVTTEGASQVISATATDAINESATASVTLKIDKTAPALAITSPANNSAATNSALQVAGTVTDALSGVANVSCNGSAATVTSGSFSCSVSLTTGANTISVVAADVAGNQTTQSIIVTFGVPTIASLAPASGSVETSVTISGSAFGAATGQVTFNGIPATVSTWGDTSISVSVPAAATTGNVVVTTATNVASNGVPFTVIPLISSLTPSTGPVSQPVTIAGTGFGASAGSVNFAGSSGSVPAVISSWTNTSIGLTVPTGAITGNVFVVANGLSSSGVPFTVVPPVSISATISPTPNAAGWNNVPVFVAFQCFGGVPPMNCPGGQTVSTDGANQLVTGAATDALGNSATASTHINLDQVAPAVAILTPDPSVPFSTATVAVTGTVGDSLSGVSTVTCNGSPASVTSGNFTCNAPISATNSTISVQAIDIAGNVGSASQTESPVTPKVHISAPTALLVTNQQTVNVSGTVDDPATTVSSNGVQGTVSGSNFTINAVPLKEGKNLLTVAATNVIGGTGTDTVSIFLDTTPPTVHVDSPTDGGILTQPQVTVTGSVNDIVTGTVNSDQVSVTVNGATASVSNRSFSIANVLLVPGTNTITAIARDPAGNISQHQIQVTLRDLSAQQKITLISGNNQQGVTGTVLANPLVVQLVDGFGRPLPGRSVNFHVTKSDGTLQAFPNQGRDITLLTGPDGQASVQFQLGSRVGVGVNQVSVGSSGFVGEAVFSANSMVGPPTEIRPVSGETQKGQVGSVLPEPLVVIVTDAGGNPVPGASVLYTVGIGGGSLEGGATVTKTTDGDGKAVAVLTLGPNVGISNNMVTASLPGTQVDNAGFISSAIIAGSPAGTTIAGVVLDNADQPIPNVTVSVKGTNFSALTNPSGQFTIANAPVGNIVLYVDGSTSTRPETFPTLSFQMATVPGVENSLSGPIFLPAIDVDNSQVAGGDQDVVLTMKGVPGVAYKVFAHSVTFADGSHVGRLSLTQVHADRVPMALPNGTAPRLMATLQPPGVSFNPPIQMIFPNTLGLSPGQVLEIFSYRHDLEQFVVEGTGHVSDDGSTILSDPGSGLSQSGWDGAAPSPPPPTTTACSCAPSSNPCIVSECKNSQCVSTDTTPAGGSCHKVDVVVERINRDNPKNTDFEDMNPNFKIFGGSDGPHSDSLRIRINTSPTVTVTKYTWTVDGAGTENYTLPTTSEWNISRMLPIPASWTVNITVQFSDGASERVGANVEVGIRTDEIAAVAWINENNVPTSISGVRTDVVRYFPPPENGGPASLSAPQAFASSGYLGLIAIGQPVTPAVYEAAIAAGIVHFVVVGGILQSGLTTLDVIAFARLLADFGAPTLLTPTDKAYILRWMFKNGGNDCSVGCPPALFSIDPTHGTTIEAFLNGEPTSYKLINHLQADVLLNTGTTFIYKFIKTHTAIGTTIEPFLGIALPGQKGPFDGAFKQVNQQLFYQVNDGTPDAVAVKAFNVLMQPLMWSNIGSRIVIGQGFGTGTADSIVNQVYPTYNLYLNGVQIGQRPQLPDPVLTFTSNPYSNDLPDGPAPFKLP